ncbi:MAG: glycosyltransferase family 39 protein, partial [Deltaproteobacteria bacterium]|nr:glycosyltransferase family 39 protein [Deltaproteobacteria bacterium]
MEKKYLTLLTVIFIIAVSLRLGAAIFLPGYEGPDAPAYRYVAENLVSYIKGVPIKDKEQLLKVAERRGWLYPFFIAVLFSIFGQKDFVVSGLQILLDGFSCVLLYLIGRKVFSKRVAVLASFLAVTYPGFIYYSKFMSQETTITFLLLLLVYLIISIREEPTWKNHLLTGFCLGVITFYRPSYQFLFIPFLPFFAYYLKKSNQRNWRVLFVSFTVGLMIIILGWITFSYKVNKQFVIYKSSAWAFYETLRNDGWVTDDYFPIVDENLRTQILAMGYPSPPKGTLLDYDHSLPASIYLKLGLNWIRNHPLESISQMLKRIYRMWFYIETYPAKWHSKTTGIPLVFHRLLIILSLLGVSLSLSKWRSLWIIYLLIFYANLHIFVVGIPRYSIPSMPLMLLLASYAVIYFIEKFKRVFLPLHLKGIFCVGGFIISSLVFYFPSSVSIGALLSLLSFLRPEDAHFIRILMGNVNFLLLALMVYYYLREEGEKKAAVGAVLFVVLSVPVLNSILITNKVWHEWWFTLQNRNYKVVQKIYVPEDLKILPSTKADLFIDMMGGKGKDYTLVVRVNGKEVRSYKGGLSSDRGKFEKRFSGYYDYFFFRSYHLRPEDLRQWYKIPLDIDVLTTKNPIEIECSMEGNTDNGKNYVYIFGDYVSENLRKDNIFEGPSIPFTNQDTSLYKIMPYEGDCRFETRVRLQSEKRESLLCEDDTCQGKDL